MARICGWVDHHLIAIESCVPREVMSTVFLNTIHPIIDMIYRASFPSALIHYFSDCKVFRVLQDQFLEELSSCFTDEKETLKRHHLATAADEFGRGIIDVAKERKL